MPPSSKAWFKKNKKKMGNKYKNTRCDHACRKGRQWGKGPHGF